MHLSFETGRRKNTYHRCDGIVGEISLLRGEADPSVFVPLAEYAGSTLTSSVPQRQIVRIGDRLALEKIIDNLVYAVKYGAGRPINVTASEEASAGEIHLEVRDYGPGICAVNQARIFERFERAVQPGAHGSGLGVGLWIVRQLAEAMGGAVKIFGRENEGAGFTVYPATSTPQGPRMTTPSDQTGIERKPGGIAGTPILGGGVIRRGIYIVAAIPGLARRY
jgi:hypothetical protein